MTKELWLEERSRGVAGDGSMDEMGLAVMEHGGMYLILHQL